MPDESREGTSSSSARCAEGEPLLKRRFIHLASRESSPPLHILHNVLLFYERCAVTRSCPGFHICLEITIDPRRQAKKTPPFYFWGLFIFPFLSLSPFWLITGTMKIIIGSRHHGLFQTAQEGDGRQTGRSPSFKSILKGKKKNLSCLGFKRQTHCVSSSVFLWGNR